MKILKKCLTCGAEFIASKMSNKYCCRECERDASRKREAKRKKSVRESEKEAARILGKSEQQVTNLVHRGKKSLKKILEERGFIYADE